MSLLKFVGGPGSIGFLAAGAVVGIAVSRLSPRSRVLARVWLLTLVLSYIILGLPVVAQGITAPFADPLAGRRPVTEPIDVLVVFDGDNRIGRVEEGARLWAAVHPAVVIASGTDRLVEHLRQAGIPSDRIVRDAESATTREQVEYVKHYLSAHDGARVAVIASRLQMPRVIALTRRSHVDVALYSARVNDEARNGGWQAYVPTYSALLVSRDALYERVALEYYRWRDWIDDDDAGSVARKL